MLSECIYTSGGGGGGSNPVVVQNWSQSAAINYSYTIDLSKTYLLFEVYKSNTATYDSLREIKNGEITRLLGTDSICTLTVNGTSLSITAGSGSYVKYIVFMQLD